MQYTNANRQNFVQSNFQPRGTGQPNLTPRPQRPMQQIPQTQGTAQYGSQYPNHLMFMPTPSVQTMSQTRLMQVPGSVQQIPMMPQFQQQAYAINPSTSPFQVTSTAGFYQQMVPTQGTVYYTPGNPMQQATPRALLSTLNPGVPAFTPPTSQQQSYQKRERKGIAIVDPNTGQPVQIESPSAANASSHGTPVGTTPPPAHQQQVSQVQSGLTNAVYAQSFTPTTSNAAPHIPAVATQSAVPAPPQATESVQGNDAEKRAEFAKHVTCAALSVKSQAQDDHQAVVNNQHQQTLSTQNQTAHNMPLPNQQASNVLAANIKAGPHAPSSMQRPATAVMPPPAHLPGTAPLPLRPTTEVPPKAVRTAVPQANTQSSQITEVNVPNNVSLKASGHVENTAAANKLKAAVDTDKIVIKPITEQPSTVSTETAGEPTVSAPISSKKEQAPSVQNTQSVANVDVQQTPSVIKVAATAEKTSDQAASEIKSPDIQPIDLRTKITTPGGTKMPLDLRTHVRAPNVSKHLRRQLESLPPELLAGSNTVDESPLTNSEENTESIMEKVQANADATEPTPVVSSEEKPKAETKPEPEEEADAENEEDRKKKPPRQRLKEEKKPEDAPAPEKPAERKVIPQFDFTPVFVKAATPVSRPAPSVNDSSKGGEDHGKTTGDDRSESTADATASSGSNALGVPSSAGSKTTTVISTPKASLQYDYKEDQWSPLNLEGKKAYDRAFLLNLQYVPGSVTKPDGLPNLPEVVLEECAVPTRDAHPGPSSRGFRDVGLDFTPGFVKSGQTPKGMPPKRGSQSRGGSRHGEPRKVISIQREQVDLHRTDNAYKVFNKSEKATDEEEKIVREFRAILNKLTPQKFSTLITKILELPIKTENTLKRFIDTIFEKAIDEPGYSVAYANACVILSKNVIVELDNGEKVSFKKLLLNRCQHEFEKDKSDNTLFEAKQKEIDEATSEDQKKHLQEDLQYEMAKAKRRSLGNIRFIGELFKLSMLTEKIIDDCVFSLLKATDEESLECLCRLLTTVGKMLDVDKLKGTGDKKSPRPGGWELWQLKLKRMDQYFERIDKIINEKKTSSRVRFMLQDVVDLRKSNWVPRRDENNPKTIEQIHKEAENEKAERQLNAHRLAQEMRNVPSRGRDRPDRGQGRVTDGDGWTSVPTKANTIDPDKLKITKPVADEKIQLGPGGRGFGGWGRGSTGGGRNTSQEAGRPPKNVNRFNLLREAAEENKRSDGGRMGPPLPVLRRSGSYDKGPRLGPGGRSMGGRLSTERNERESAMAAARQLSGGSSTGRLTPGGGASRNQSRESSRNREAPPTSAATPPVSMKPEEVERKTKAIVDEYLQIHDLKEAVECVKELPNSAKATFVETTINHVLERNTQARHLSGNLLHDLVKSKTLSVDQYLAGLKNMMEIAEDMEIDVPKIWQYFGELIGPMVQDGSVPLRFLREACEPIRHAGKAGKLVAAVLHDASQRLGYLKVGDLWRQSELTWSDFLTDRQDLNRFIEDNKLEFTQGAEKPPTPTGTLIADDRIEVELKKLLERGAANESIFDWVGTNISDDKIAQPVFIRALATAVCASAIKGTEVNTEALKTRCILLQRFLDHSGARELQALYALQALVDNLQHPSGVLRSLFDVLYDEDIISEDAFNHWEKSTDPADQQGKGVALSSVNQFFTWLRNAEEEEEEVQ